MPYRRSTAAAAADFIYQNQIMQSMLDSYSSASKAAGQEGNVNHPWHSSRLIVDRPTLQSS